MPNNKTNTAIVLYGATRWGRLDVPQQFESIGVDAIIATGQEDIEAFASKLDKEYKLWCVLTLDDFVGKEACALAEHAPVDMYPVTSFNATTQKHQLRGIWNKYIADNPSMPLHPVNWALFNDSGEAMHDELMVQGPYIVKPNAYAGSVGMEMVTDQTEIAAAVKRTTATMLIEASQYDEGLLPDKHVLVEEAIPRNTKGAGIAEYSVHMMSVDGKHQAIAFSEKNINKISFIETAHLVPAELSHEYETLMEQVCADMLDQLQVENLISNWEFIITPEGKIGLIEGQLRPSGDKLMHLIQLSTGENPYQHWIKQVLGSAVNDITTIKHATVTWLSPKEVIHQITSVELPKLPNGVELNIDKAALLNSENWPGPVDWYNRYISVVASASKQCELNVIITDLADRIVLRGVDKKNNAIVTGCKLTL